MLHQLGSKVSNSLTSKAVAAAVAEGLEGGAKAADCRRQFSSGPAAAL